MPIVLISSALLPYLFYGIATGWLGLVLYAAYRDTRPTRLVFLRTSTGFFGVCMGLLTFLRLPSILYNREVNPDESQVLAQALTLAEHPVYWRSVDGTTIGPINSYLLLLPNWLGLPLDYTTARLTGLLLIIVALFFFYRSLLLLVQPRPARLAFVAVLLFFATTVWSDFIHYSSELTTLPILTGCFWLSLRFIRPAQNGRRIGLVNLSVLGLATGLVPYCKLQAIPILAALIAVVIAWLIVTYKRQSLPYVSFLIFCAALPTMVILDLTVWYGVFDRFVDFYLIDNLMAYSKLYPDLPLMGQSIGYKLAHLPIFWLHQVDYLALAAPTALVLAAALPTLWARKWAFWQDASSARLWTTLLVLAVGSAACYAVAKPGTEFGHHLFLLVFPCGWMLALGLQVLLQYAVNWLRPAVPTAYALMLVLLLLVRYTGYIGFSSYYPLKTIQALAPADRLTGTSPTWLVNLNPYLATFPRTTQVDQSVVTRLIRQYSAPDDRLVVWGWNGRYYVESQLSQGTSENHAQRCVIPNPLQKAHIRKFMTDLERTRPAFFVDAVGKNSTQLQSAQYVHESIPPLAAAVRKQYRLLDTLDGVRVYMRTDLVASRVPLSRQMGPWTLFSLMP